MCNIKPFGNRVNVEFYITFNFKVNLSHFLDLIVGYVFFFVSSECCFEHAIVSGVTNLLFQFLLLLNNY